MDGQIKNHPTLGNIHVGFPTQLIADSFELQIKSAGALPEWYVKGQPVKVNPQRGVLRV